MSKIIMEQKRGNSVAKFYGDSGLISVKEQKRNWGISLAEKWKWKIEID
jgi:hypothetical protein